MFSIGEREFIPNTLTNIIIKTMTTAKNSIRNVGAIIVSFVVALGVVVPSTVMADGPATVYTTSYKPTSSYTTSYPGTGYTSSYRPSTNYTTSYKPYTNYTTSYKPYTNYTTSYKPLTSTNFYKYPTSYKYPSYNSYPSYNDYGSYGSPYGSASNLGLSFNFNDNDNENNNSNVNNNVITIGNQNGGGNNDDDDDDDDDDDHDEDLWCDLNVSPSRIDDNDEAELSWDTRGATYAVINQGIGVVDEDGGEEEVSPNRDTTYRLTVRNNDGDTETCSATLRVDDEDNNFSSTVFIDEEPQNPPVVYLSSIPYTGAGDISPEIMAYWLLLIAGAGAGAWFLYTKGVFGQLAFASLSDPDLGHVSEEVAEEPATDTQSFVEAVSANDTATAVEYLRAAAINGVGVEEFLTEARATVTDATLASRLDAAIEGAQMTGIRGAKAALA
jgi:hypothetical protein